MKRPTPLPLLLSPSLLSIYFLYLSSISQMQTGPVGPVRPSKACTSGADASRTGRCFLNVVIICLFFFFFFYSYRCNAPDINLLCEERFEESVQLKGRRWTKLNKSAAHTDISSWRSQRTNRVVFYLNMFSCDKQSGSGNNPIKQERD